MTWISKNVYADKLDNIASEYNNAYQRTIKTKSVDVKSGNYIKYNVDSKDKDPKFKIGDHIKLSKYKNNFAKEYTPNWSEEVFAIKKNWKYSTTGISYYIRHKLNDLKDEKIIWISYEKNCKRSFFANKHL